MTSKILIVDDEPSALQTVTAILEGDGYTLQYAEDGLDAINQADEEPPDLILLDVMMPVLDGFEVCRMLRNKAELHEVPIVMLTALDDRESKIRGLQAGADDFISKPLDPQELRARVGTITRLNRYRILMQQREELKVMAERVMNADEEQRLELAREIHDEIGQALDIHEIQLHRLLDSLPQNLPELRNPVLDLITETGTMKTRLHGIIQKLRPPLLDTMSLPDAFRAYTNDFSRRTEQPVSVEVDGDFTGLPESVSVTLYRVLQEALTNVVKHAEASQAWVALYSNEDEISLTVQDNGKGTTKKELVKVGHGLHGLRERTILAGGNFQIVSSPGYGLIVSVRFPKPAAVAT
jgi:signal transduction histidine kinase